MKRKILLCLLLALCAFGILMGIAAFVHKPVSHPVEAGQLCRMIGQQSMGMGMWEASIYCQKYGLSALLAKQSFDNR